MAQPLVGIVMGSKSDLAVMQGAMTVLERFGVPYEDRIISAHRTPRLVHEYAATAEERGLQVVIAGAGKAAHLAGAIASLTTLPVIGVPMPTNDLGGMDSLLSTVQMPSGVPVATVAIGGAKNAAILAIQILAVKDNLLRERLKEFKASLDRQVTESEKNVSK